MAVFTIVCKLILIIFKSGFKKEGVIDFYYNLYVIICLQL